ncbi:MAG: hypothetical protein ACXAD7_15510 [Candidatus Kariarchaeaceae archaeon]|jgi:hypothetical protein
MSIKNSIHIIIRKYGGLNLALFLVGINTFSMLFLPITILKLVIYLTLLLLKVQYAGEVTIMLHFGIVVPVNLLILLYGVYVDAEEKSPNGGLYLKISDKYAKITGKQLLLAILGLIIFEMGHGMHFTANLFWYSEHRHLSSALFEEQIYYFDELLGHYLLFSGFHILVFSLAFANQSNPGARLHKLFYYSIPVLIPLVALIWILLLIEGLFAWQGYVLSIVFLVTFRGVLKKREKYVLSYILFLFFSAVFIMLTVILLWYGDFYLVPARLICILLSIC